MASIGWTLEVVADEETSLIWTDLIPTEQAAWDEFIDGAVTVGLSKLLDLDDHETATVLERLPRSLSEPGRCQFRVRTLTGHGPIALVQDRRRPAFLCSPQPVPTSPSHVRRWSGWDSEQPACRHG